MKSGSTAGYRRASCIQLSGTDAVVSRPKRKRKADSRYSQPLIHSDGDVPESD